MRGLTKVLLIVGGIPYVVGAAILLTIFNPPPETGMSNSFGDRLGIAISLLIPYVAFAVPSAIMLRNGKSTRVPLVLALVPIVLLALVFIIGYGISGRR